MDQEKKTQTPVDLVAGVNTHENVIVPCVGGFSNTGMTTFFATIEVIKTLGLQKVSDACVASVPLHNPTVDAKINAAKKIIAVDGCPNMCAKKMLEKEGFKVSSSIVLDRDIGMTKVPFNKVMNSNIMDILKNEEIQKAKD
jgi:uncharacterized metal-binding protein